VENMGWEVRRQHCPKHGAGLLFPMDVNGQFHSFSLDLCKHIILKASQLPRPEMFEYSLFSTGEYLDGNARSADRRRLR
jgi:hypothetical protein